MSVTLDMYADLVFEVCGFQAAGTATATRRFGALPTLIRATSLLARVSMMEQASLPVLLTQQYLPSGEKATQLGPAPVWTSVKSLFAATSKT